MLQSMPLLFAVSHDNQLPWSLMDPVWVLALCKMLY